ncbi:cardiac-enriched FHL2-interacting protein [Fundulus diaphanus]
MLNIREEQQRSSKGGLQKKNSRGKLQMLNNREEQQRSSKGGLKKKNSRGKLCTLNIREEQQRSSKGGLEEQQRSSKGGLQKKNSRGKLCTLNIREEQQRSSKGGLQKKNSRGKLQMLNNREEQQRSSKGGLQKKNSRGKLQMLNNREEQQRSSKGGLKKKNSRGKLCTLNIREEQQRSSKGGLQKKNSRGKLQMLNNREEQQRSSKGGLKKKNSRGKLCTLNIREEQQRSSKGGLQKKNSRGKLQMLNNREEQQRSSKGGLKKKNSRGKLQMLNDREEQQRSSKGGLQKKSGRGKLCTLNIREEQQRSSKGGLKKKNTEEQQRRLGEEEQQRKAVHAEQQRRAAEEQQRRLAEEQRQIKAAKESQQRREIEEQQRRAAHMELQRQLAAEQQRKQDAHEEQQRKTLEEHQRTIAQLEQQMSISEVKQQRRAAEEQQRRFKEGPQMKKSAHEEWERTIQEKQREAEQQQCTALQNEQQRKATEEKQRRASQLQQREAHKQQMKIVHEEKQRREAEEQQWRVAQKNQQKILSPEEQQRRELDEQERKGAYDEQQRKAAQGKQQSITSLHGEQRQVKQVKEQTVAPIQKETKGRLREDINVALLPEKGSIKQIDLNKDNNMQDQAEEPVNERPMGEDNTTSQKRLESENIAAEKEKLMREQRVERHVKHENVEAEETLTNNDRQAKKAEGDEQLASLKEKARYLEMEMDNRAAQRTDALQYYAITSASSERKPRERQLSSPLPPPQQNKKVTELESASDSLFPTRPHRPHAAASPAPSLPRSNTSSPALGVKPLMFRVKDNTIRGSSFTKSVKPRFHRNFGEDFPTLGGGSDKTEEDQDMIRRNAGTPLNRFSAISESAAFSSPSSLQDYSNFLPHLRPYSRRSMVMDDDESRSVISNMSEDVESFATSAADLTDLHGQFDLDRPESACSFSSDASRSLGKPPVVPPKSEKALRRAQRLTSRRIRKELTKAAAGSPAGVGKEAAGFPSSSSSSDEVRSTNHHAVASPHFSPPVTFALAPAPGSSLPSSHTNPKPSHCSFHASPHATGPISIPSPSPHAGSAVSLHASGPASKHAALQTVAHVSSSPTLHHVNPPAPPVTQYHVESTSYPQSYPLTQRKVLQDLGSGQYFVVDVPVQVKTKTFFDPETGKYVQLNVRQTAPSISQPPLQQAYQQPQVPPQMQVEQQQMPLASVASVASKPFRFYHGYHNSSQHYQTAVVNPAPPSSSAVPATPHQNPQMSREAHSYGSPVPGVDQNSEGHRYSPEKAPYMDTVSDVTKTHNLVNSTQETRDPFLDCDTDSQLGRSSVCENERSANSEYEPRDIIAISELEDFMEVSDW